MTETVEVLVGIIGRAHGLRGDLSVHVRTDEPGRRFHRGVALRAGDRTLVVRTTREHGGALLVAFEGVDDRSTAEQLRGTELWAAVPAAEMPSGDDEFFDRALVGLRVRDQDDRELGTVTGVVHLPAHDSLVVTTASGTYQVPFVSALVPMVDLEQGVVEVAAIGGLLGDVPEPGGEN
ncbi:MAG: ribosome maturation factor RimM [Propioniciclava sp.]